MDELLPRRRHPSFSSAETTVRPSRNKGSEGSSALSLKTAAIVGGAAIGAGLLTAWVAGVFAPKKKKAKPLGITVTAQCSQFNITDPHLLRSRIREYVQRQAKANQLDPLAIAAGFMRQPGLKCTAYPANPRNPGEAELYFMVVETVTSIMEEDRQLSAADKMTIDDFAAQWAASKGAPIEHGFADEQSEELIETPEDPLS